MFDTIFIIIVALVFIGRALGVATGRNKNI